jgi:ABC-type transporter Mla MlaB component
MCTPVIRVVMAGFALLLALLRNKKIAGDFLHGLAVCVSLVCVVMAGFALLLRCAS